VRDVTTNTSNDVYQETIRMNIHELVRRLNEAVGTAVVQSISGCKDRGLPNKWAKDDGPEPSPDATDRLRLGFRVWRTVEMKEGKNVALAWLVGANPRLGEKTPVTFVRELRHEDVLGAAQAFVDDIYAA
jgi:hypothetical protein